MTKTIDPSAAAAVLGRRGGLKGGLARARSLTPVQRSDIAKGAAAARWGVPKETHDGVLDLVGFQIPCAVLDNKTRVLTRAGVSEVFGSKKKTANAPAVGGAAQPPAFLGTSNVRPHLSADLLDKLGHPIAYRTKVGRTAIGYEASVLPQICEAIIDAERSGALLPRQQRLAEVAHILHRGLARVAIVALVDEATGYQVERDRDELQVILAKYIAPELLRWTRRFPAEFYEHMFRLWKWQYSPPQVSKPQCVGIITNRLIYDRLPPGVREQLEQLNPTDHRGRRSRKHHQFLTEDIGNDHLERQILSVMMLMKVSKTRAEFEELFKRAFPTPGDQTDFSFDEDE